LTKSDGIKAENLIWIFGSIRSGSTWLIRMMGELDRHQVWDEPGVGRLFGEFYDRNPEARLRSPGFIMGDSTRKYWINSIRTFVLSGITYTNPEVGADDYLAVKEPGGGSMGAPLLMEALPESRMILLVRDPRDIMASVLDSARKGGWFYELQDESKRSPNALPDRNPNVYLKRRSNVYLQHMEKARQAYDEHQGPKVMVRYEELRADTLGTMQRIYSTLEIPVDENQLARAVEKHSWENIPDEKKGEGKFNRKARPGSWQEDLTPEQVEIVEEITAPLLRELYAN
jgi:hypothetical protein